MTSSGQIRAAHEICGLEGCKSLENTNGKIANPANSATRVSTRTMTAEDLEIDTLYVQVSALHHHRRHRDADGEERLANCHHYRSSRYTSKIQFQEE